jgi:hypothetical protein
MTVIDLGSMGRYIATFHWDAKVKGYYALVSTPKGPRKTSVYASKGGARLAARDLVLSVCQEVHDER